MYPRQPIPQELVTLAAQQAGVLTSEQCQALGLGRHVVTRLIDQQSWQRLAQGIYLASSSPAGWPEMAWAGLLIGGDRAVLAGRAAGHLWGLVNPAPDEIDVLVPHSTSRSDCPPWRFIRTRQLPPGTGHPVRTWLPDTVLDLCVLQPDRAATWIDAGLHNRALTADLLRRRLEARPRHPQRKLVMAMLQDHVDGIHSELERRYARDVEKAHGLPIGERQVAGVRFRVDVQYGQLIVELDGRLGHAGSGRFRDMTRDNHHLLQGKLTLRFGWDDVVHRPCQVAHQVAAVLADLGWPGPLETCASCRRMPTGRDFAA